MAIIETPSTRTTRREYAAVETRIRRILGWDPEAKRPVVTFQVEIDYSGTDYEVDESGAYLAELQRMPMGTIRLTDQELLEFMTAPVTFLGQDTVAGELLAVTIDQIIQDRLGA